MPELVAGAKAFWETPCGCGRSSLGHRGGRLHDAYVAGWLCDSGFAHGYAGAGDDRIGHSVAVPGRRVVFLVQRVHGDWIGHCGLEGGVSGGALER